MFGSGSHFLPITCFHSSLSITGIKSFWKAKLTSPYSKMIGTLAVALATISKTRDGAGAFAARVGLGGASGTHSAPGYGYGPVYYANDAYAYRGG